MISTSMLRFRRDWISYHGSRSLMIRQMSLSFSVYRMSVARLATGWEWDKPHGLLLDKLRESGQLDFSYTAVDSSSVRADGAGQKLGQTPPIAHDQGPNTMSS